MLKLVHVKTTHQLVDPLTKALLRLLFDSLVSQCALHCSFSSEEVYMLLWLTPKAWEFTEKHTLLGMKTLLEIQIENTIRKIGNIEP